MMERHAYIILAHSEPQILETLVALLDDERNDLFIHVDAKASLAQFANIRTHKSGLTWTPRVKVYWGGPSQIKAERTAIQCARAHGSYARYHIISGVDLPIKSQDYIHDFCNNKYSEKEFVGFNFSASQNPETRSEWQYYHVLGDYVRCQNPIFRKTCSIVRHAVITLQRLFHAERHPNFEIMKGAQWVSISQNLVDWLFSARGNEIYKFLLHAHCADEKWMQTSLWNSPYRDRLFDTKDEMHGCMRAIDWNRGGPYVWKRENLDELKESDRLFARKFSSHVDTEIVNEIKEFVSMGEKPTNS